MATVTMDLNEIDKLRDDLKINIELVKQKEQEIVAIKADKRTIKETITRYVPKMGTPRPSSDLKRGLYKVFPHLASYDLDEYLSKNITIEDDNSSREYRRLYIYGDETLTLNSRNQYYDDKKTEYVNFDDVREQIRKEAEEKVNIEIGQLRAKNAETEKRISELSAQYQDKILDKDREHAKLNAEQFKKYAELQQEFEDLKADKKRISREEELMEMVKDLTKKLDEEKNKSWWSKLFG